MPAATTPADGLPPRTEIPGRTPPGGQAVRGVLDQAGITPAALQLIGKKRLRRPHHGRAGPLTERGAVGPL